jgi:hypothetical protein
VTLLESPPAAAGIVSADSGAPSPDVVRRAIHILYALVSAADSEPAAPPAESRPRAATEHAAAPAEETA